MKSDRRKFLAKTTGVAAAAAVALPAGARAQTSADKPVKRVHWPGGKAPETTPLFRPIVTLGSLVFVSGINQPSAGDIRAQTKAVLDEIEKRLASVGSSMEKVLKVNVYLNDLADFAAMNEMYLGRFGAQPPVRTTIASPDGIPGKSLVEIDCIASL